MIVLILLTILVAAVPTMYMINSKYVQRIALFIGASQIALLAMTGKIDNQLSAFLVEGCNHVASFSLNVVIQKLCLFIIGM
jgi:hypothetical protein